MKTYSKIKGIFYRNIVIEDESGMDLVQIKKQLMLSNFASHLRTIAGVKTPVKSLA
jgi:hypothetical protein